MWTIDIRKDGQQFQHVAHDLRSALAVACLMLRDGIAVERVVGPEGAEISAETLRSLCDGAG